MNSCGILTETQTLWKKEKEPNRNANIKTHNIRVKASASRIPNFRQQESQQTEKHWPEIQYSVFYLAYVQTINTPPLVIRITSIITI